MRLFAILPYVPFGGGIDADMPSARVRERLGRAVRSVGRAAGRQTRCVPSGGVQQKPLWFVAP